MQLAIDNRSPALLIHFCEKVFQHWIVKHRRAEYHSIHDISFLTGMAYLVYKLLFWRRFSVGIAPVVIGMFFVSSILLVFMGVMGEYIGAIHTQIQHRPYAVEQERVNFEYPPQVPLKSSDVTLVSNE